ncbi:MAG: LysM peptidoglycan-binding domain-containing protein [Pseudomonadota bacterium]
MHALLQLLTKGPEPNSGAGAGSVQPASPAKAAHSEHWELRRRVVATALILAALLGCQRALEPILVPVASESSVSPDVNSAPLPSPAALWLAAPVEPPAPPTLWTRLRDGFELDHNVDHPLVAAELRWLKRHPQYFQRRATRLGRYLPLVIDRVTAEGLPLELSLIPIVESALDPYAFSPGGAAGLWQFIPATGKRFGLERTYWYEARRDINASTDAALSYLKTLHRRFDDWHLAMAAYNAGEGNVGRALRRLKRNNIVVTETSPFWQAKLPGETTRYVPRILALAAAIADPDHFGVTLPELDGSDRLQILPLPGQFDLMRLASATGIAVDTLYALNPALNQWATPPEGPHRVFVPPDADLATLSAAVARVPDAERVGWSPVVVKSGDTLSTLAQRHRVDIDSIRRSNELRSDALRAGQTLLIPTSTAAADSYPIPRRQAGKVHHVAAGESLWEIARRYGVTVKQLVRWNEMHPKASLQIGQKLFVSPSKRSVVRQVRYRVRSGDSLYTIAKRFKTTTAAIAAINSINPNDLLKPGKTLRLEVNVTQAPKLGAGQ